MQSYLWGQFCGGKLEFQAQAIRGFGFLAQYYVSFAINNKTIEAIYYKRRRSFEM
ncbi:MAG: hypothetical protein H6Q69_2114 [Firmicutes bacterium]|nr:hypothetical protein [Bacillota bacterium]